MLDRAICNMALIDSSYSVVCNILTKAKFDHYPILISIKLDNLVFKSQFKFHKIWTMNVDCERLVKESWKVKFYGYHMYILDQKLKLLKSRLKVWNNDIFGNVQYKTVQTDNKLKSIQQDIEEHGYTTILQEKEIKSQHDLDMAVNIEEELWKENSRPNWHLQGDRNTKFFHFAKIKSKSNLIYCLNINGNLEYDQHKLESHIESHFFKLFNSNFERRETGLI